MVAEKKKVFLLFYVTEAFSSSRCYEYYLILLRDLIYAYETIIKCDDDHSCVMLIKYY